jgi:hypothetical protein
MQERAQAPIVTGVPSGSVYASRTMSLFGMRMQPWLTLWPMLAGSFVPDALPAGAAFAHEERQRLADGGRVREAEEHGDQRDQQEEPAGSGRPPVGLHTPSFRERSNAAGKRQRRPIGYGIGPRS